MRRRFGPYEISVASGHAGPRDEASGRFEYRFRWLQPSDKVMPGGEYRLVTETGDDVLVSVHDDQVRLVGPRRLDLTSGVAALVVYRWFLYSRLKKVLHALMERQDFHADTAVVVRASPPDGVPCVAGRRCRLFEPVWLIPRGASLRHYHSGVGPAP